MSLEIKLTFPLSAEEKEAVLWALRLSQREDPSVPDFVDQGGEATIDGAIPETQEKKKRGRPRKEGPVVLEEPASLLNEPEPEIVQVEESKTYTEDEIREYAQAAIAGAGLDALVDLLEQMNCAKVKDVCSLPALKQAEFVEKVSQLGGGDKDA